MRLGVYLGWHVHPWEELLALVRLADELGYDAAFVDGDATLHPGRETLDGWTVTVALLALTRRIAVGSLRIAQHWNAARLAQCVASAERIAPGRLTRFPYVRRRMAAEKGGINRRGPIHHEKTAEIRRAEPEFR